MTTKYLLYPSDWPTIAYAVKSGNHWRCQACNKLCRRPGEMYLGWEYEIALAHLCQDYEAEAINVAALCAACHLAYDAGHSWIARQRQMRARMERAGQLVLITK